MDLSAMQKRACPWQKAKTETNPKIRPSGKWLVGSVGVFSFFGNGALYIGFYSGQYSGGKSTFQVQVDQTLCMRTNQ